ncbi:MAG: hypothetical protein Kow0065_24560 [Methylomicrobium sp.]
MLSLNRLHPTPSEIEAEIRLYMRLYLQQRLWFISKQIAELLESLLKHPDFTGTIEQRCGFMRLARLWRFIAWLDGSGKVSDDDNLYSKGI